MNGDASFPDEQTYSMIIESSEFKEAFDMFVNYAKTTRIAV